jgi:hypothetical protein
VVIGISRVAGGVRRVRFRRLLNSIHALVMCGRIIHGRRFDNHEVIRITVKEPPGLGARRSVFCVGISLAAVSVRMLPAYRLFTSVGLNCGRSIV